MANVPGLPEFQTPGAKRDASEGLMYMSTTLGVATISYAPYAFLCYLGAVFAVICGYTGIGIARSAAGPTSRPTSTETAAATPVS